MEYSPGLAGSPSTHSTYCTVCVSHRRGEKNFLKIVLSSKKKKKRFCLIRQQKHQAGWGTAQLVRASLVAGELSACLQAGRISQGAHPPQPTCRRHIQPHPSPSLAQSLGDSLSPVATSSSRGLMWQPSHNPRDSDSNPGLSEPLAVPCSRDEPSQALPAQNRLPCTHKVKPQLPLSCCALAHTQPVPSSPHHARPRCRSSRTEIKKE